MSEEKVTPGKSLIPYSADLIKQASMYCDLMHFPPEAVSAVLSALDMHSKLKEIVEKQRKLPDNERALLIDTKSPLAAVPLKQVDDFVAMHGIPYNVMTWFDGKPYPKADGLRYKLAADPRILKLEITIPLELPKLEDNTWIGYECIIEFYNGQKFSSKGVVDLVEMQSRRRTSIASPGFMAMIAETRAKRRNRLSALGLPTGIAEEVMEGKEFEEASKEAGKAVVPAEMKVPGVPTNKAQLMAMALNELNLRPHQTLTKLGIKSFSEIKNFTEAWRRLKEE